MRSLHGLAFALPLLACAVSPSHADPVCRAVEVRFAPGAPNMQIAVWIEDGQGHFTDTAYITRLTGQFGLGNRPGTPLLKTDFRWPYGRREMVLPVWAHRRNVHYPKIMMGGICGNSPLALCPNQSPCGGDCEDSTIAYHSKVSTYEPFYCSPSGASKIDAMSCASKGTFSKGAYADQPTYSLYPPRADLNNFGPSDSPDAPNFAMRDDLVAISAATPVDGQPLNPAITWFPDNLNLPDGDYVAWVEMSAESDFNNFHNSQNQPNQPDTVPAWDFEGHAFLGQPSVLYKVPFHFSSNGSSSITTSYAGYGSWDGTDGNLRPPDNTIETKVGSGAGRLLDVNDGVDTFRVKVVVGGCGPMPDGGVVVSDAGVSDGGIPPASDGGHPPTCVAPDAVSGLKLVPSSTAMVVTFHSPQGGVVPGRFSVRYHEGDTPFTDDNFNNGLAADELGAVAPGSELGTTIHGLLATTTYTVGVRAVAPCGQASHVVSLAATTPVQQFVTLNGCFVATAAYGTPMAGAVSSLRRFRDQRLLDNAVGRLFVAGYYAFSPPLARAIAGDRHLRALSRAALQPLVDLVAATSGKLR